MFFRIKCGTHTAHAVPHDGIEPSAGHRSLGGQPDAEILHAVEPGQGLLRPTQQDGLEIGLEQGGQGLPYRGTAPVAGQEEELAHKEHS